CRAQGAIPIRRLHALAPRARADSIPGRKHAMRESPMPPLQRHRTRKAVARGSGLPASLQAVHLNAAGIDIGSAEHYVAVPADRDPQPVRRFACFTADLERLAEWLEQCGIDTVAMESTGVYWIPLFQILETRGFEVKLVNARHVKTVPRRKSDVQDCQWLQQLHTFGLLAGSFRPDDQTCVLRSYLRQRDTLIRDCAAHIQRMQKALTQMNIHLHQVISDITGATGMRILRAILAGERNPVQLAARKDPRVRSSPPQIPQALRRDGPPRRRPRRAPLRPPGEPGAARHLSQDDRRVRRAHRTLPRRLRRPGGLGRAPAGTAEARAQNTPGQRGRLRPARAPLPHRG